MIVIGFYLQASQCNGDARLENLYFQARELAAIQDPDASSRRQKGFL
jgi:hypothetical protein